MMRLVIFCCEISYCRYGAVEDTRLPVCDPAYLGGHLSTFKNIIVYPEGQTGVFDYFAMKIKSL